ncbi:C2 calcium-dependent domain-containing protein 4C-like [Stigmatopora nigra]
MWLLDKLRHKMESGRSPSPPTEAIPVSVYANVLTPEKIPHFFIPPKLVCCPPEEPEPPESQPGGLRASSSDHVICVQGPKAKGLGGPRLFRGGDARNLQRSANRHIIQIESADEPPTGVPGVPGGNTNADPQSQTAMSLPYVPKAQTSYGFSTLMESPHTRRKESLFHSSPASPLTSPNSHRRSTGGTHLAPADNAYRYFSGGESDTCSSAESLQFHSPLLSRSASLLRSFTKDTQAKVCRAKRSLTRHSSLSTDDCSSADNSPNVRRRRPRCPTSPALRKFAGGTPGGATASEPPARVHTVNLRKGGTLRLSTHYDPEAARLRVRVLTAESVYGKNTELKSINCCVTLYLKPGKKQKQRSTIIRNSRNPVFNEDFFFDALPQAKVKNTAMKIKVVNRGTSLKRNMLLGEREVMLSDLLAGL